MVDISKLTTGVNLPAQDSGRIFATTAKSSAFLAASTQINISANGEIIHGFGESEAYIVGETEVKTLSNPAIHNIVVTPKKFVVLNTFSDEIISDAPQLASAIRNGAPSSIAKKVDSTILSSASITGFGTLGALTANLVEDDADLELVISSLAEGTASALVLSTTLLGKLRAKRTAAGARLFDIVNGEINGLAYYSFKSNADVGFVGDFAGRSVWGTVGGVRVKVATTGNVGEINLLTQNMVAVLTESRIAFGVDTSDNYFAKITSTPVV